MVIDIDLDIFRILYYLSIVRASPIIIQGLGHIIDLTRSRANFLYLEDSWNLFRPILSDSAFKLLKLIFF